MAKPYCCLLLFLSLSIVASNSAGYDHVSTWEGSCNTASSQSPINIDTSKVTLCGNARMRVNMWNGVTTIYPKLGTGSTVQTDYPTSVLTMVDSTGKLLQYSSIQYHMHDPSEHLVNGRQTDLYLHIVHGLNSDLFNDTMKYAVLGLMFQVVENVPTLFDYVEFSKTGFSVNFNQTLGKIINNENTYHYKGSLTTPTCDEVVNWFVIQSIYPIRASQLAAIKEIINDGHKNSRPTQPLNGRTVYYVTPTCNQGWSFYVKKSFMALSDVRVWVAIWLAILTLFY